MKTSTFLPFATIEGATAHAPRGHHTHRRFLISLLFLFVAVATGHAHAQTNYKWEDAEGETIYEPTPPDDPDQPYCERQGDGPWTCFEGADRLSRPAPDPDIMTEEQRQKRADQLLVTRYRSLDGIEQGRQDRLRQLNFERQSVVRNGESQQRTLFNQIRAAADRQRAGLAVPQRQLDAIEFTRRNLEDNDAALARIDAQAEAINKEHEAMKNRFRELMEQQTAP